MNRIVKSITSISIFILLSSVYSKIIADDNDINEAPNEIQNSETQNEEAVDETVSTPSPIQTPAKSNNSSSLSVAQMNAKLKQFTQQRASFLEAEKAVATANRKEADRLLPTLTTYPLYPYLVYEDYTKDIKKLSEQKAEKFISEYGETAMGMQFRARWLELLAERHLWAKFVKFYHTGVGTGLQCKYREALINVGRRKEAMEDVSAIWFTEKRLPKECDSIIEKWTQAGKLKNEMIWGRIELSFRKKKPQEAKELAKFLPKTERHWVDTWMRVYKKPDNILQPKLVRGQHHVSYRILTHGTMRFASSQPDKAGQFWTQTLSTQKFSHKQVAAVKRAIGLSYAYKGDAKANFWLSQIPDDLVDNDVKFWRIRSALAQQRWPQVIQWIQKLDTEDRDDPRWKYWRARALEATGQKDNAHTLYVQAAKTRSFEGFLAADRLKVPYAFENRRIQVAEVARLAIETSPAIARARELYHFGRKQEARREWHTAIQQMNKEDLKIAAVVAHQWGWHERTILTLGKAGYHDDLGLRFPILHKNAVLKQANKVAIDPAWAMAVIRRESAFDESARSHAGALGLMQLMPQTARSVARSLKAQYRGTAELFKAELNIRFGTTYLRMALDKFNNNKLLATAAYNAGGHRVTQWLGERQTQPIDIWIETIPFTETRDYCRNVMAFTTIYEQRMGLEQKKLSERLPPISKSR